MLSAKFLDLPRRTRDVSQSMPGAYIFCYHAVVDQPLPFRDWCFLDSASFRWQMEQLKKHFEVVSLSEASARINSHSLDSPLAVVTFDDGFLNFYTCALPILQELAIPSTLFVATGFIDTDDTLWFCRLNQAIANTKNSALQWRSERYSLDSPGAKSRASEKIQQGLKTLEHDKLLEELHTIIRRLGGDPDEPVPVESPYRMLNREELREIHATGLVELGAHTVSHVILSRLGKARRQSEIRQSIADIAMITGSPCTLFAYPNGELDDYGEVDVATVAQCGVSTAVNSDMGIAVNGCSRLELPRLPIGSNITRRAFIELFGPHDLTPPSAYVAGTGGNLQPSRIRLDAASACQLRCPCCVEVRTSDNYKVADGWLPFHHFKKILDDNPRVARIELSNWGEIFLNPELVDILRYAHERGVSLSASNGVNLNHASDDMLEALVKYQLNDMTCSVDGASNAVYKQYRVRGDLDRVLANIERINYFKDLYQSQQPRLSWQFVVFAHNQHETGAARQLAHKLDMTFKSKLSWDPDYSAPAADIIAREFGSGVTNVREYTDVSQLDDAQETMCSQLWVEPVVNWDGVVFGCCANFWQPFELNAFTDGLHAAVNSPKMHYARAMLTGEKPALAGIPCTTCRHYEAMQATGKYMDAPRIPAELRAEENFDLVELPSVPDVHSVWRRTVWRHYIQGEYSRAGLRLQRFCSEHGMQLSAVAKPGLLDTRTEQMLPAIERFVRDCSAVLALRNPDPNLPVALYLTAFGQSALRGERATAWRCFKRALRHSGRLSAVKAWLEFFLAAVQHADRTHRARRRSRPHC